MSLSKDVVVIVKNAFKEVISGTLTFTLNFRTSPPNDLNMPNPVIVFRCIQEDEVIRNIHGTKFRDVGTVWAHIMARTKPLVTEIKDAMKTAHRSIWKNPGTGLKHILWKNVVNNDHEDWNPVVYERIIKLEAVWEDT